MRNIDHAISFKLICMQHLLLLHGAMGAKEQFKILVAALKNEFIVHTLNFSGHGGIPIAYENFSIPFLAEVMNYLDNNNLTRFRFSVIVWEATLQCMWP